MKPDEAIRYQVKRYQEMTGEERLSIALGLQRLKSPMVV
jgi:hypothetical protein